MKIVCTNSQPDFPLNPSQVELLVQIFLKWKKVECDEVSIHFVDKQTISDLHQDHFQDPTPTDCISFPIDSPDSQGEGYKILGEVFVCPQVAIEYAEKNNTTPEKEISLYIIHGLLHLLGYDDQDEISEPIMRDEEKSAMSYLKQKDALLCID